MAPSRARPGATTGEAPAGRFDLLDHPMFFLAHILTRFDGNVVAELRRHGFSQSDWRVISTLQYADDLTLTELARITTLERSFVGRVVGTLEERGLVRRTSPADDRRTTRVRLTDKGRRSFAEVLLPATAAQIANAFEGIGEEERGLFFVVLRKMMRNVYHVAQEATPILD
ncbi:MarR family winged helix-turn-helix transcriptional regulator [Muricoccus nepalensis]|nr:MarR family transcriptional regulator [Roseomonas nepalensis]